MRLISENRRNIAIIPPFPDSNDFKSEPANNNMAGFCVIFADIIGNTNDSPPIKNNQLSTFFAIRYTDIEILICVMAYDMALPNRLCFN
ncbi:hypothetical protein DSECCO2_543370 [anaerobic digester metagenome]